MAQLVYQGYSTVNFDRSLLYKDHLINRIKGKMVVFVR